MVRPALAFDDLPQDALARREVLEERAKPNPSKPKLAPDREARLANVEERSAQCYLTAEETIFRLRRLANRINTVVPRYVRPPSEGDR